MNTSHQETVGDGRSTSINLYFSLCYFSLCSTFPTGSWRSKGIPRIQGRLQHSQKTVKFTFSSHKKCFNCSSTSALESAPGRFIPLGKKKEQKEENSHEKKQMECSDFCSVLIPGSFPRRKIQEFHLHPLPNLQEFLPLTTHVSPGVLEVDP